MRCLTYGEPLEPGTPSCPVCGSVVATGLLERPRDVSRCPRCGYHGQGVTYFSRPGHIGLLVGVSIFTYGLGGLVYWLARRRHLVCPSCGLGWEHSGRLLAPGHAQDRPTPAGQERREEGLPSGGFKRRVLATVMILLATFMILMGVVEVEAALIVFGSVAGVAGTGTFYWGLQARQARRQALLAGLQSDVLRLATRRGGSLTVTEVAADLNISIPAAEKVLTEMDDGFRVRSDITREGVLLFEFPEVQMRAKLGSGRSPLDPERPAQDS